MTVFLPWPGHFGDLIRDVLPWLWASFQPGDILAGNPAHAVLYPGPIDERLWAPVARTFPEGYDYHLDNGTWEAEGRQLAADLYPGHDLVSFVPGQPPDLYPKPAIPLPADPIAVDVVLAPRRKPYPDAKAGWPWAALARLCRERGWTVGLAGSRQESEAIDADRYAWDEDPPGDTVTGSLRLLAGARVLVSQDSGIGHLASLVNTPQVVIYPQRGDERRALVLRDGLRVPMRFADMHRWNASLCLPAWGSPEQVLVTIAEALSARILPGPIDPWKPRPVTTVPNWQPGEVVVIHEPDRSLILRPGGNDLIETAPLNDLPPRPSDTDIAARAAACQTCPDYQPGADRCRRCGCGFVVAERTRSRFARCPAGRWS